MEALGHNLLYAPEPGMDAWVLYDDACGFCRTWIPAWVKPLRKRGIAVAPLQAKWVVRELEGSGIDLMEDILLMTQYGQIRRGADVYRYAMRRIWWLYPLWLLVSAPGIRWLMDRAYRVFADNRYRISRSCGLRNPAKQLP